MPKYDIIVLLASPTHQLKTLLGSPTTLPRSGYYLPNMEALIQGQFLLTEPFVLFSFMLRVITTTD